MPNNITCSKFGVLATRKSKDKESGTSVKKLLRDQILSRWEVHYNMVKECVRANRGAAQPGTGT